MPSWLSGLWQLGNPDERDQSWRYTQIEKLDLQPGDTIVVAVHARTTAAAAERLKAQLAADFPNNQVVVLPRHSKLSVLLRASDKEEPKL